VSHPVSQEHTQTECRSCGVTFTVPTFLHSVRSKSGASIYCPNGHALTIPVPDELVRLRDDVAVLTRKLSYAANDKTCNERFILNLENKIRSLKGSNTVLQRRLKAVIKERDVLRGQNKA
jgi:hypothetical protein